MTDHDFTQQLLPWYATGALDAAERHRVEEHLAGCDACQDELATERALRRTVARTPLDTELGWADMRRRLGAGPESRRAGPRRPSWVGWAIAAQIVLLIGAALLFAPLGRLAPYHALGAPEAATAGNALLMFRPETSAARMQGLLAASDARIVDGPTAAGAWVVHVDGARLGRLRAQPEIALAEPIAP